MKKTALFLFLISVVWCSSVLPVSGAGFLVFEQGSKAMGMAGAFTATADDPSAIFNNPAGITQLSGTHVSIGNTFVRNDQKYDVDGASTSYHEEMASRTFFLPHLYLTHEMNDKLTLGFGYYTPFGIGTDWADNAVGNSVANEAHIKTYDFNPNLAYKMNPKLSLALGVHYLRLKTQIIRNVGLADFRPDLYTPVASYETFDVTGQSAEQLGRLKLDARGGGWAYNLGLLYKINEFWKAGISYRSDMKVEISRSESTVDWRPSGNLMPVQLISTHAYGYTKLGLPGIFLAGVSTTMFDKWNIEFDVQYTTWNHFDDLVVKLEPGLNYTSSGTPGVSNQLSTLQEDWKNVWGFHLGTEYKYTDNFAVRTGYFYDKNPIPDRNLGPILPDSDRHSFSLGCGYTRGDWTLDTAYMYSHFKNRSTDSNYQNFNASYKSDFHLLGVTVTRKI